MWSIFYETLLFLRQKKIDIYRIKKLKALPQNTRSVLATSRSFKYVLTIRTHEFIMGAVKYTRYSENTLTIVNKTHYSFA